MINACKSNATYILTKWNATEIWTPGFYPRVNRSYPEDLICNWKIKGTQNKRIHLTIDDEDDYEIEAK